jgi:hypothetical protein
VQRVGRQQAYLDERAAQRTELRLRQRSGFDIEQSRTSIA